MPDQPPPATSRRRSPRPPISLGLVEAHTLRHSPPATDSSSQTSAASLWTQEPGQPGAPSQRLDPGSVAALHERILGALRTAGRSSLHERMLGALVGSAAGNAVGLYTVDLRSWQARDAYPRGITLSPPSPLLRGRLRSRRQPGDWTSDTDNALLVLLSFLHSGESTASDLARRLKSWTTQGLRVLDTFPVEIGRTFGVTATHPMFLKNPFQAAYEVWAESGRTNASNGSLMRTHPLGLTTVFKPEVEAMDTAARLSCVTHVDPRCVVACMIGTALVRRLVRVEATEPRHIDEVIVNAVDVYKTAVRPALQTRGPFSPNDPHLDDNELRQYTHAGSLAELHLDGPGRNFVYKTLGAGLVCLRAAMERVAAEPSAVLRARVFEPLLAELVTLGGDADTHGCFAGALLGAYAGFGGVPAHWVDGLTHGKWLMRKGECLCRMLGIADGDYDGMEDRETYEDGGRGYLTPQEMARRWSVIKERAAADEAYRSEVGTGPSGTTEATLFIGQIHRRRR